MNHKFFLNIVAIGLWLGITTMAFGKTDKYRCIWRDDPATTMTIGWNQRSGKQPIVYYGTTDYGTSISAYEYQKLPSKKVWAKGMNNHFARLTGLQPNTTYYFVIQDSDARSQRYWFKTAPDSPYERLSIMAGGDSRNHRKGRQNANKMVAKLRPHCVVFGGDMTGLDIAKQWEHWFEDWQLTISTDNRMTPIIAARGNHERSNNSLVDLFDVPHPNVHYALTLGGSLLRVYTLNTMISTSGSQKTWLENDLHNHDYVIWKMAQYHHPMRPHTKKKAEGQRAYRNWANLFYQHQVQLVVECDAHVVKTTWPVRPSYENGHDMGFIRDNQRGTVYVGEGCWGAPLRSANDNKKWTRNSGSFNQVKWIFVDQDKIEVRTVKTDNVNAISAVSPYDIFTPPSGLKIWRPSNGSVIRIKRRGHGALAYTTPKPIKRKVTIKKQPTVRAAKRKKVASKSKKTSSKRSKTATKRKIRTTKVVASTAKTIELVVHSFKVTYKNGNLLIDWKTNGEPAGTVCTVERSLNGFDFQTVSRLSLLGNTTLPQKYQMYDSKISVIDAPFIYYRLKHSLPNGAERYSNKQMIRRVEWEKYPLLKPESDGTVSVEFELIWKNNVQVSLFDNNGKVLKNQTYLDQLPSTHLKKVDVSNISAGVYLLSIHKGDGKYQHWRVEVGGNAVND